MLSPTVDFTFAPTPNVLTEAETQAGWRSLFDGQTTAGWHNFREQGVKAGWEVKDGVLTNIDPHGAGDIVTNDPFDWFELKLDFRVAPDGNSGIMLHCADEGEYMWFSGPEIQIIDNERNVGGQLTGWLYELYPSEIDSTKPTGEWNQFHIVVAPRACAVYVNGIKYFEYEPGSSDFWERVKKSKFDEMPMFARLQKGTIGIQGDHGVVSFRNIKVRPLELKVP